MDLGLSGKSALVTGSYRGTGAGIAACLADEGVKVWVHSFQQGDTEKIVEQINESGGTAEPLEVDLFADEGIDIMMNQINHVDILVNSYGTPAGSSWKSIDNWDLEWEQNVLLGVKVTQALIGGMRAQKWGRVIFVGTVGVDRPRNHSPGYYGAKASLHALVRTLAMELQGTGVTANMFNPGMIATEEVKAMLTKAAEKRSIPTDWENVEKWASNEYFPNLTSSIATPEDIGRVVSFLSSVHSWYINGASIAVDGGSVDA
ncbi:MAG: SDR family NAD(P)-dependent oxidoreductase [Acidimicrobiales bacterium]|nr:SDR family NAD(P)-dependent oxidoreductase [Acidimicrobiales bacterium]